MQQAAIMVDPITMPAATQRALDALPASVAGSAPAFLRYAP